MHMQIVIELGSDALDGETVKLAARQAIDTVATAIGHDVPAGSLDVGSPLSVHPINVKFKTALRGPGQPGLFDPPTYVPAITPAEPTAGGN